MQSIQLLYLIQPTSQKHRDIHCAFAAAVLSVTGSSVFFLGIKCASRTGNKKVVSFQSFQHLLILRLLPSTEN